MMDHLEMRAWMRRGVIGLQGLGPWDLVTGSDARSCGVGLSWDSALVKELADSTTLLSRSS